MVRLEDETLAIVAQLERLEALPSTCVGDWHRLEARVARALVTAQQELAALQRELLDHVSATPPDPSWHRTRMRGQQLAAVQDELRFVRLAAQGRLFEAEAGPRRCREGSPT